jgi:predicted phosphodiesterase
MADSHGQSEAIEAACDLFKTRNCRSIYHLGDICDSSHPETAGACLKPLKTHRVIAIRGNNDHAIVANHIGRTSTQMSPEILQYLHGLPLMESFRNALFVHSLPFVRELGLSSMIGTIGQNESLRFFAEFPKQIAFRGHSHSPEIAWLSNRRIETRFLAAGEKVNLSPKTPCIVTCGALTRGLCMVWRTQENSVECFSFK